MIPCLARYIEDMCEDDPRFDELCELLRQSPFAELKECLSQIDPEQRRMRDDYVVGVLPD